MCFSSMVAAPAVAVVVPTTTALPAAQGTVTFDQFPTTPTDGRPGVACPASNGETVTFSGTGPATDGVALRGDTYGLDLNGQWSTTAMPKKYASIQLRPNAESTMRFTFTGGDVRGVSAFVNYAAGQSIYTDAVMTAFDAGGLSLGTFDITATAPISTPGQVNGGAFRGFNSSANDIHSVLVTGAFVVLDDLSFTRVPEPTATAFLGLGLYALRRRRSPCC